MIANAVAFVLTFGFWVLMLLWAIWRMVKSSPVTEDYEDE